MKSASLDPEIAYDLAASHYDDWSWQSFWRNAEAPLVQKVVGEFVAAGAMSKSFLDVGCGTGYYSELLAPHFSTVSGLDLSSRMLDASRARLPSGRFLHGGATSLPFFDRSFDVVLCARVLSHVTDVEAAMKDMLRVMLPGGLLVVTNVDAGHAYGDTRLPSKVGDVFARTVKHQREDVFALTRRLGLVVEDRWLVTGDGGRRRYDTWSGADEGVVGWIAAARRPGQKAANGRVSSD